MGSEMCIRDSTNGVFTHPERDLRVVVHVDDFLISGEGHQLQWFRDHLTQKYELKVQVAGWGREDHKELSFLGRVIRLTPSGIELEGDDKHVGLLEEEWGMSHCNPVATPYVKPATTPTRASGPGAGGFTTGMFDVLSGGHDDYDLDIPMLVLEVGDVPKEPI